MAKSSMGMEENVAALLSYVLGWVTGLIFFLIEKESKFVKFHAMQSIITFGALTILSILFFWLPVLIWLLNVIGLVLWIVLMIKAYQGVKFKLPFIGDLAEKWSA
ncbi:MAG: DUF4870 domain-containing protein [Dehalococcoidia bacterium]|jgi:uncharacterized membrane protein